MRNDYPYNSEIVERVLLDAIYLKSDITKSYALNTYGLPHPFLGEETLPISYFKNKKTKKVLPYILFIQNRFYNLVHDLHKGKYVDEDTGLTIYSGFYYTTEEWSDNTERVKQAAVLLKAFIEIQNTLTVPDWFKEEYQRLEALELLEA